MNFILISRLFIEKLKTDPFTLDQSIFLAIFEKWNKINEKKKKQKEEEEKHFLFFFPFFFFISSLIFIFLKIHKK